MPEFAAISVDQTVLIAAGGTGGHVFPALAVAERLREQSAGVIWLGTRRGLESRVVPESNIAIEFINVVGVRGKTILYWLKAPFLLFAAVLRVITLMRRKKVAVVLGMGGYVSVAAGLAAVILRKPLFLQEQNAIPGTANKLLAPFARKIFTGFAGVFANRKNVQWSGNPLRSQFINSIESAKTSGSESIDLLVVGGSLGAHVLNITVPGAIAQFKAQSRSEVCIKVVHQTGERDKVSVEAEYRRLGLDAKVLAFIDDISAEYRNADLVIARAGALTVSEICAVGVAAVFIPYPHAIDDHQSANAAKLVEVGAARLLPQSQLSTSALADVLLSACDDPDVLSAMACEAKKLARLDAAEVVASACREVIHG